MNANKQANERALADGTGVGGWRAMCVRVCQWLSVCVRACVGVGLCAAVLTQARVDSTPGGWNHTVRGKGNNM